MVSLPQADLDALALDLALHKAVGSGAANLLVIADRHGITRSELRECLVDPGMEERVRMAEETSRYEASAHKMRCASLAERLLASMTRMALDETTPASARAKIYELIVRDAGVASKDAEEAGTPVKINIDLRAAGRAPPEALPPG